MKKILTSVLAASMMLLGVSAFAQVSVGAGYVNSTFKGNVVKANPGNGFYVGMDYLVPVGEAFGLSAGVDYTWMMSKGISFQGFSGLNGLVDLKSQYINVPVRLNAGFDLSDGIRVGLFAGPTLSYALAGQASLLDHPVLDLYKDLSFNRFDVLVGGGLALTLMDHLRLSVGYDLGMFNLALKKSDGSESSSKINRNQLHAGLAFLF